jgi:hypothetical protein
MSTMVRAEHVPPGPRRPSDVSYIVRDVTNGSNSNGGKLSANSASHAWGPEPLDEPGAGMPPGTQAVLRLARHSRRFYSKDLLPAPVRAALTSGRPIPLRSVST